MTRGPITRRTDPATTGGMHTADRFIIARHAAGLCHYGGRDWAGRYMYCARMLGHRGRCTADNGGTLRRESRGY